MYHKPYASLLLSNGDHLVRLYAKAAILAYQKIITERVDPQLAWERAVESLTESFQAQKKVCPKETFLGLAFAGYLFDVEATPTARLDGVLRRRAVNAANALIDSPELGKKELSEVLGYVDKQGSYDIVIELARQGILQQPQSTG